LWRRRVGEESGTRRTGKKKGLLVFTISML
jgi:hypothetical protein